MNYNTLKRDQYLALIFTATIGAAVAVWMYFSARDHKYVQLAAAVGALGGLAHEVAQSGGKIAFFRTDPDGVYIGSIAGMILGAIAGLMVARGLLVSPTLQDAITTNQVGFEGFFAGLGLKGVLEAAGTKSPSNVPANSSTDPQALLAIVPSKPTLKP